MPKREEIERAERELADANNAYQREYRESGGKPSDETAERLVNAIDESSRINAERQSELDREIGEKGWW